MKAASPALFAQVMLFFINDSFLHGAAPFHKPHRRSCTNDDYQHFCFCPDQLIHDTDTGISELNFQEPSQIITLLVSQRLSIATFCNGQRILKDFSACFNDPQPLISGKILQIFCGFRQIDQLPVHSMSTSPTASRASCVIPSSS